MIIYIAAAVCAVIVVILASRLVRRGRHGVDDPDPDGPTTAHTGAMLSALMRMKKASDDAMSMWWSTLGLPTKRDQERTLHELHRLQSKILDLEEQLAQAKRERVP